MVDQTLIHAIEDSLNTIQIRHGVAPDTARRETSRQLLQLLKDNGGRRHYIPSIKSLVHRQIRQRWKQGDTISQIAADFELTERSVYNIIAGC